MSENSDRRLSSASTIVVPALPPIQGDTIQSHEGDPRVVACENGDIEKLKNLDLNNTIPGLISSMFHASVIHGQSPTFRFLCSKFESHEIWWGTASSAFTRKDPVLIRALLEHDPSLADYEESYRTILHQYCAGSDPTVPLLLLEFGADPTVMPYWLNNPLDHAIEEQPMVLIERLIKRGAIISDRTVKLAGKFGRQDVAEYLKRARRGGWKKINPGRKNCVML